MLKVTRPKSLLYPAGRLAGFDPRHIGNKGGGCTLSTVAIPAKPSTSGNMFDLLSGVIGTGQGATGAAVFEPYIGPVAHYTANGDLSNYAGKPATVDSTFTIAFIANGQWTNLDSIFGNSTTTNVGTSVHNSSGNEI